MAKAKSTSPLMVRLDEESKEMRLLLVAEGEGAIRARPRREAVAQVGEYVEEFVPGVAFEQLQHTR